MKGSLEKEKTRKALVDAPSSKTKERFALMINKRDDESKQFSDFVDDGDVCDFLVAPLVNVCSVTVCSSFGDACKIYGEIFINVDGVIHKLYERDQSNAETVPPCGGTLLLNGPVGGVVTMAAPAVTIKLRDKAHDNDWFAIGQLDLDTVTEGSNAEYKSASYHSDLGEVSMNYIAMACAVVADVKVKLIDAKFDGSKEDFGFVVDNDDVDGNEGARIDTDIDVLGTVLARYGKTIGCKIDGCENVLFSVLNGAQRVAFRDPIKLSRSLICVPAYSLLVIEVSLIVKHCGTGKKFVVNYSQEFMPGSGGEDNTLCFEGDVCFEISVKWFHSDNLFPCKCFDLASNKETKNPWSDFEHISPATSISCIAQEFKVGFHVGEICSISIGHDRSEPLRLCGAVRVCDIFGISYGFNKDNSHPEILFKPSQSIPLQGMLSYSNWPLNIHLCLYDVKGNEIIRGYLSLNYLNLSYWMDRPLCSVIRGDHGYAAVYYIVFSNAVQALVDVYVAFEDPVVYSKVCGRLVARYGNFEMTHYEAQHYHSVLFERLEDDEEEQPTALCKPFKVFPIPLRRSVVSIPLKGCLNIEVDLQVYYSRATGKEAMATVAEHLRGKAAIKIGTDGKYEKIKGLGCDIGFSVKWVDCLGRYFVCNV